MGSLKISMEAARVNAKFTQKQLAKRIGVSDFTIRNWEIGKVIPRVDQFYEFCRAVGVNMDDIILPNNSVKQRKSGVMDTPD